MSYFWCVRHSRVEDEKGCASTDRMGPYATADEAEHALETARRKTAERDAQDAAEDDWGRPPKAR